MADEIDEVTNESGPTLTPIQYPKGWVPGRYAACYVFPDPVYGPDELGQYKSAIDDLSETVTRADSSARLWEVLQSWEARNMSRNYQFGTFGRQGWGQYGAGFAGTGSPGGILQYQQQQKLFPCNVYGAREDKVVAVLSRQLAPYTFVPKRDSDPIDQTAADEAKKYLQVWMVDAGIKKVGRKIARLFYTDGRACTLTLSVADQQRWGTETPDEPQETFDAPEGDGITPETELDAVTVDEEVPAIREVTEVDGKLEWKVPLNDDEFFAMAWIRRSKETNVNTLRERYPWVADKINPGATANSGAEQMDRMARVNVRLAVQTTTSSGESTQQDATESITFYRPSQFRSIKDEATRDLFYETFPDGLVTFHAGGTLAMCVNAAMDKHVGVMHAKEGDGQNRRAVGTNYLPMQKILNANIGLLDRYFRNAIARRFAAEGPLDVEQMNQTSNDPAKVTGVVLEAGQKISDLTGIETVPQPNDTQFQFVQWLIDGAPEAMDGLQPAALGGEDETTPTFGATKLKKDAALQIYSAPYAEMNMGLAKCAEQAAACAAANRVANMRTNLPGQGKIEIEISKLRGNALCHCESLEIPQSVAEEEAQMAELLENASGVAIYKAIADDPENLAFFANFPTLAKLNIPGLKAVQQQEGEFEKLLKSGPLDNPKYQEIEQQIEQGKSHPEAQTPEGQQAMQQLQQALQSIPPQVSSVPVAQNGSENHAIHAAITLGMMEGAEGRKLKNGNQDQQNIYRNLELHWEEHEQMKTKLTPVPPVDVKYSVSAAVDKAPPNVQSQAWGALGLQAPPEDWQDQNELVPHEVTVEKEGVDAQGVPVKQKTAMINPSGKLS